MQRLRTLYLGVNLGTARLGERATHRREAGREPIFDPQLATAASHLLLPPLCAHSSGVTWRLLVFTGRVSFGASAFARACSDAF